MEPQEAIDEISDLIERIDEDVPEWAWDKAAPDFFEDIKEMSADVSETIEETQNVTPAQESAIRNWVEGVGKWIKN